MNKQTRNMLEGRFFQKIFKNPFLTLDNWVCSIFRKKYMSSQPINPKKVLFTTFTGGYTCNPKAIANEIIKRKLPWELVWATTLTGTKNIPSSIKTVLQGSAEFYQEAATSKMWISNGIAMTFLGAFKKKEQIFIQTWHGAIGLKRLDTNKEKLWIKQTKENASITDYCISNSKFEDDLYRNTFWKTSEILTYGHARNDILFSQNEELKKQIFSQYSIPENAKIAMYAPTFRDDKGIKYYDIDFCALKNTLTEKFGGEWYILSKLHPRLLRQIHQFKSTMPDFVIDATEYDDIQELMLVTDVGITDYSSWICEFLFTGRIGFLYGSDLKSYNKERGLLFPLEEFPCPLATNNEELIKNIKNFNFDDYTQKVTTFLNEKGAVDDGNASKRIVDKLIELMEK